MKYETQRVAYWFFAVAMALFALQVLFGILAATVYVMPEFMAEAMPFHIMRMSHTNLLVVWLLMAFMGCTYYLMPEEAEAEIHSPMIAYVQLGIFAVAGAGALFGGRQSSVGGGKGQRRYPPRPRCSASRVDGPR